MSARVPFLRGKLPRFWFILFMVTITTVVVVGLYRHPLEAILVIVTAVIGITVAGTINKATDDLERAKNLYNPAGPNEVLSFSLEEGTKEVKNK